MLLNPFADYAWVGLLETCPVFAHPAQVVTFVNTHRRREQERDAEPRIENQLARFGPEHVGLGEQRIETIEVAVDVRLVEDVDALAELGAEPGPNELVLEADAHVFAHAGDESEAKLLVL